jgi:hypothetical protein
MGLSRRASDQRRSKWRTHTQHYKSLVYTNGHGYAYALPKTPLTVTPPKSLVLSSRLTVHGSFSPLLGGFLVTSDGKTERMSRDDLNCVLQLRSDLRIAMELDEHEKMLLRLKTKTAPTMEAETVYLLTAWCASTTISTIPLELPAAA